MVSLSSSSTLLPPVDQSAKEHPPIYSNLNAETLESSRQSASSSRTGAVPSPAFVVNSFERSASIRINDLEFHGTQYKEPGHVEVFLPERNNADVFQSHGCVGTRITVKQQKPMKVVGEAESVDLSQPGAQKIIQLLSSKPHSAADLASKTNESPSFVAATSSHVAKPNDHQDIYVLKEAYRPAPASISKPKPASRQSSAGSAAAGAAHNKSASTNNAANASNGAATNNGSGSATNGLTTASATLNGSTTKVSASNGAVHGSTPSSIATTSPQKNAHKNHVPAGRTSSAEDSDSFRSTRHRPYSSGASSLSSSPTLSPPTSDEERHERNLVKSRIQKSKTAHPPGSHKHARTDSNGEDFTTTHHPVKRVKVDGKESRTIPSIPEDDQETDMFELARKFRNAYSEYRESYSSSQHRKTRPPKQVRKLMAMHNQLASWKEKLWSNARSRQIK